MGDANSEAKAYFTMSESDLLKAIGRGALEAGFGASEFDDADAEAEGKMIVEGLKPAHPNGLCAHPAVQAFIANPTVELGSDILAVIGDVVCHAIIHVPPVALTVAFARFGLRQYCGHRA